MKRLLILLLILSLFSCKSKKVVSTKYVHDTINVTKVIKVTPKQLNTLTIDDVCDSLGQLKVFKYTLGNKGSQTIVTVDNNKLKIEQSLDSLYSIWEKQYIGKTENEKDTVYVDVVKSPFYLKYLIWYSILLTLFVLIRFRKSLLNIISWLKP